MSSNASLLPEINAAVKSPAAQTRKSSPSSSGLPALLQSARSRPSTTHNAVVPQTTEKTKPLKRLYVSPVDKACAVHMCQTGGPGNSRMVVAKESSSLLDSPTAKAFPEANISVFDVGGVGKMAIVDLVHSGYDLENIAAGKHRRFVNMITGLHREGVQVISGDLQMPGLSASILRGLFAGRVPVNIFGIRAVVTRKSEDGGRNIIKQPDPSYRFESEAISDRFLIVLGDRVRVSYRGAYGEPNYWVTYNGVRQEQSPLVLPANGVYSTETLGNIALGLELKIGDGPMMRVLSQDHGITAEADGGLGALEDHYELVRERSKVDSNDFSDFEQAGQRFTAEVAELFRAFLERQEGTLFKGDDFLRTFGSGLVKTEYWKRRYDFRVYTKGTNHLFYRLRAILKPVSEKKALQLAKEFLVEIKGPVKRFCDSSRMKEGLREEITTVFDLDDNCVGPTNLEKVLAGYLTKKRPDIGRWVSQVAKCFCGESNRGAQYFLGNGTHENNVKRSVFLDMYRMKAAKTATPDGLPSSGPFNGPTVMLLSHAAGDLRLMHTKSERRALQLPDF